MNLTGAGDNSSTNQLKDRGCSGGDSIGLMYRFGKWAYSSVRKMDRRPWTKTFMVHAAPHDHYRFSKKTVEDVFLEDLVNRQVMGILSPPQFIGIGVVE